MLKNAGLDTISKPANLAMLVARMSYMQGRRQFFNLSSE